MSQFFISCKESRIENNRSFYGCFYLGPFDPSQSITIANALRRTLLSELYGLGMVSVEIEGATHEYSSLPGVRDSVLDILLNLKEIVFKKNIKNFKPQIGYLRARGPGVVRASQLRLPPFIQCVDPDQYIATLADNGFLNMKYIIQYGNKWLSPLNSVYDTNNSPPPKGITAVRLPINKEKEETKDQKNLYGYNSAYNFHLKKRRLILKKLKQIGIISSNSYINLFSQSAIFLSKPSIKYKKKKSVHILLSRYLKGVNIAVNINKKYPAINLKKGPFLKKLNKSIEKEINLSFISSIPKTTRELSAYSLYNSNKEAPIKTEKVIATFNKKTSAIFNKKSVFFNANPLSIDTIFNPINKVNYIIELNDFKTAPSKMKTSFETSELYEMLSTSPFYNKEAEATLNDARKKELENILAMNHEINPFKNNNISLELWTNGSIHPRDALYQGLKNLIKLFAKLQKISII